MRLVRYTIAGHTACGAVEGEVIAELRGDFFGPLERTGTKHRLADVKVEVPLLPRTFYAAGLNYTDHIIKMAEKRGGVMNIPQKPDIGYRAINALIAHDETVIIPRDATRVQYEGEIVVVIGKKGKRLSEGDALSCVLGYTIGNDVSERNWQKSDRTLWRSKNTDTFKPMGPWIETEFNLDAAETIVRLNGEETLCFKTDRMIFGIAKFISTMTKYLTLYPGDVIWMGTDGRSPDLKPGDVVEIDITGIGVLRNRFILEDQAQQ